MEALFKKLNYKSHPRILCLNPPAGFEAALTWLAAHSQVHQQADGGDYDFGMAFATSQRELDAAATTLAEAVPGDGILWLCYPKGSSKNYRCDFNRDTGWALLGELGFEPVRQVAIDDDWSALRFRRVAFIKNMQRSKDMALTAQGKSKTRGQ